MIEQSLAGPVGLFAKFSTLQDYGVDKVFFLENDNLDTSQKNVVFLASGEKASQCIAIAGMYVITLQFSMLYRRWVRLCLSKRCYKSVIEECCIETGQKVDCVDSLQLYLISLDPKMTYTFGMIYSVFLAYHRFGAIITC